MSARGVGGDLVIFLWGTATAHHHTTAHHTVGVMDCMGQHGRGFIVHFDWMDLSEVGSSSGGVGRQQSRGWFLKKACKKIEQEKESL